jgi:hypothetical protein
VILVYSFGAGIAFGFGCIFAVTLSAIFGHGKKSREESAASTKRIEDRLLRSADAQERIADALDIATTRGFPLP